MPAELDGFKVKALPCKIRTQEFQGDILSPGDLLLELESAVRPFNGKEETSLLDGAGDHSFFFWRTSFVHAISFLEVHLKVAVCG